MIVAALVCGCATALIFRTLAANEPGPALDRILAHLMELHLFLDDPALVMKAQRDLFRENIALMRRIALPCLVTALLYWGVIRAIDRTWGRGALRPGDAAVVTAHFTGNLSTLRLEAPADLVVETPGVRIPAAQEVSWRVRPLRPFRGSLTARTVDGQQAPVEIPFPRDTIFGIDWLIWFLGISALAACGAAMVPARRTIACLGFALFAPAAHAANTPVIIISIDTLRADHLSAYGYTKVRTSHLDAFGGNGTIYRQIDSQIPLTLPSHTVLMTSRYPFATGVESNDSAVPPGSVTLASLLRANGYATAAFIGSMILNRGYGLDQGFDFYDSPFQAAAAGASNPYSSRVRRDGALVTAAARRWMEKNTTRPVFVFLHLFDLHTPYPLPGMAGMRPNAAGYDAQLRHVDEVLGSFREWLEREGWWRRSLVILLADHGESLGDHGETSHGYFIYESTIHVPLIVHWPDAAFHQRFADESGGLIDVAPTILDYLHIPAPPSFSGVSLLKAGRVQHSVFSESVYPRDAFGWAALRSVRQGSEKYIDAPHPEFYDLSRDPAEHANTLAGNRSRAGALKAALNSLLRQTPAEPARGAPEVSAQTRELFQSLGYTAGSASGPASGADPKDRLGEEEAYENGLALLYAGDLAGAIRGLTSVTTANPRNLPALCGLAEAKLRSGDAGKAVELWQKVLALDGRYRAAAEALGSYYLVQRDYARACSLVPNAPQCAREPVH